MCNCNHNELFVNVKDNETENFLSRYLSYKEKKDEKHLKRYELYMKIAEEKKMKFSNKSYKEGETVSFVQKDGSFKTGIVICNNHVYCKCGECWDTLENKEENRKCTGCICHTLYNKVSVFDYCVESDNKKIFVSQWTILE